MVSTVHPTAELAAPPTWRTVDFISDLHLNSSEPATFSAWRHYLQTTPADAVFMLGDLFEVWVGDDVLDHGTLAAGGQAVVPGNTTAARDSDALTSGDKAWALGGEAGAPGSASFEHRCAQALRQAAERLDPFFMHGNRDFLVGQRFMERCGATLLADPTVLTFSGQRWLLSHGDALCLGDTDYLKFRRQVRSPEWQRAFLARPLAERQAIARHMRQQSQAHQHAGRDYADVDSAAARQWLQAADAGALIHGHTHRPAVHDLGDGLSRWVLSDWDAQAPTPRADALRLTADGLQRIAVLAP